MVQVTRWAQYLVAGIVAIGILVALPNFLSANLRNVIPGWLPKSTVSLGLDLQGGSYLLLEVDFAGVVKERLETLQGDIRVGLRKEKIGYTGLDVANNAVTLHIIDAAHIEDARKVLNALASPNGSLLGIATLLAALTTSVPLLILSGALFGSVFLSVVASTTAFVRHNLPEPLWVRGIGLFTVVFAWGQIVGPTMVGLIADGPGGLTVGLLSSAACLWVGTLLAWRQKSLLPLK